MKIFLLTLLILLPLITLSAQNQTANNLPETLGENERLSFMAERDGVNAVAEPSTSGLIFRTFGALLLIGGLILAGAWGLKKFGAGNLGKVSPDAPDLAVVSTVSLGTNRTLSVVRFGEQTLLIGSTAQSFTLLAAENRFANQEFTPNTTRSVAELLAADISAEELSFADELAAATNNLESARREI